MATNTGTLVTAPVRPYDSADTYPVVEDDYIKGSYRVVTNTTERDAIPSEHRKEGMLVRVNDDDASYRLVSGILNSNWVQVFNDDSDTTLRTDLASSLAGKGAELVEYKNSGTGATSRTVDSKLQDFVSVKDFGAVGDGITDDTAAIQAAIDSELGVVYLPIGDYLCTSPIELRHGTILVGSGKYDHPSTVSYSKIIGKHTGAAILLSQLTLNARVSSLSIEGDATTTPKTGIAHGRSPAGASSGNTLYEDLVVKGYFSIAGVYLIASEQDIFDNVSVNVAGGGATRAFYIDQGDTLAVNSFAGSSNIVGTIRNCFISNNNNIANFNAFEMDLGDLTTEWNIHDNYASLGDGAYMFKFDSSTAAAATRGANQFINNGAEPLSGASPAGLFYFDAASLREVRGMRLINNRLTFGGVNAISTSNKVILDKLYYDSPANNDLVSMALNIQTYGLKESYVKTDGTVTIDSATAGHNSANVLVINGVTHFSSSLGTIFARIGSHVSKPLEFTTQSTVTNDPYIQTDAVRWYQHVSANSEVGTVLEALPAGDQAFRPEVDNTYKLGRAPFRWSEVFAGNGTINTSDEREKADIEKLSAAELRVAQNIKGLIKKFRFVDSIENKGDGARIHVGVVAQDVIAAFVAEGLDPMRYGIVCYDEWSDEFSYDDEGNATKINSAGDIYGIRYDQLLMFMMAAL